MTERQGRPIPAGGGRSRITSRDELVTATVEIIDAHGLEAVTMRDLGRSLGVSTMGLYRYVQTKEELLTLVPEHLLTATAEAILRTDTSATALQVGADGLRGVLEAHPRAAPLFAQPTLGPAMLRARTHCAMLLQNEGAHPEEALEIFRTVVALVLGEALISPGGSGELGIRLVLTGIQQHLKNS